MAVIHALLFFGENMKRQRLWLIFSTCVYMHLHHCRIAAGPWTTVGWGEGCSPACVQLNSWPTVSTFQHLRQASPSPVPCTHQKKKKIHNEVDSNEVDSSSSNPCCSRVNSIFRVESFRDTNILKKKAGFHLQSKVFTLQQEKYTCILT